MTRYYGVDTVLDPERIKITQSDLAAFKRDRRIWFLKTYLGLRPKVESVVGPLTLGTMVHAALEADYKHGHDLIEWYVDHAKQLGELYAEEVPYFQQDKWDKQAELGRVMLEGYQEWIDADNLDARYKTVDVEKLLEVTTTYLGSTVHLTGKADLIVEDRVTGEMLIFDWKTTANLERTIKQAHYTEQLPYYMTLLAANEPGHRVAGAAFNILLKSKRTARATPPFYHREHVRYGPIPLAARQASIDGTILDYVRTVQALNEGVDQPLRVAYANPGVISFDPGMTPLTDAMDHGERIEGLIAAQFRQIDVYARYAEPESPLLSDD